MPITDKQYKAINRSIESIKYNTFKSFSRYHLNHNNNLRFSWAYCGFFSVHIEAARILLQDNPAAIQSFIDQGPMPEMFDCEFQKRLIEAVKILPKEAYRDVDFEMSLCKTIHSNKSSPIDNFIFDLTGSNIYKSNIFISIGYFLFRLRNKIKRKTIDFTVRNKLLLDCSDNYELLFIATAPASFFEDFPFLDLHFFRLFSIKSLLTKGGFELRSYGRAMLALAYEKKSHIKIVQHGWGLSADLNSIFLSSISSESFSSSLEAPDLLLRPSEQVTNKRVRKILLVSPSATESELSIWGDKYEILLDEYIQFLQDFLIPICKSKRISLSIRKKSTINQKYYKTYIAEDGILIEADDFEEIFHKFDLILCPFQGSILGKSIENNLNFLGCIHKGMMLIVLEHYKKVSKDSRISLNFKDFKNSIIEEIAYNEVGGHNLDIE